MSHTFIEPERRTLRASVAQLASRLVPALVLMEWGGILTYFFFSNRVVALLHPDFRPLVLITGLLLLLSAACILCSSEEGGSGGACSTPDCEHSHGKLTAGGLLVFLVLFVPIALAAKISPDVYGVVLMQNRGLSLVADQSGAVPSRSAAGPSSDNSPPLAIEVGDLLIAAQQPGSMQQYQGKRVQVDGQYFVSGTNSFDLVRMLILCCAADAQPLAVRVESGQKLPSSSDVVWARVVGTVDFARKGETHIPIITAEKITPILQPADPNVYHGGSRPVHHTGGPIKFQLPPR